MNANLIIECTECNTLRIVFVQKKISTGRVRVFKRVTYELLLACRSRVEELVGPKNVKEFHISQNLKCIIEVEVLYYSAGFTSCWSHWGTKRASKLSYVPYLQ